MDSTDRDSTLHISMASCKTALSPLLMHWRSVCCCLALSLIARFMLAPWTLLSGMPSLSMALHKTGNSIINKLVTSYNVDGFAQVCGNSIANALDLLLSFTRPSTCTISPKLICFFAPGRWWRELHDGCSGVNIQPCARGGTDLPRWQPLLQDWGWGISHWEPLQQDWGWGISHWEPLQQDWGWGISHWEPLQQTGRWRIPPWEPLQQDGRWWTPDWQAFQQTNRCRVSHWEPLWKVHKQPIPFWEPLSQASR